MNVADKPSTVDITIIIITLISIVYIYKLDVREEYNLRERTNGEAWGFIKTPDKVSPRDSFIDLIHKIETYIELSESTLTWRSAYIQAVVASLAIWLLIFRRLPHWWEYMTSILIIFVLAYGASNHYKFHWQHMLNKEILQVLAEIKKRCTTTH